MNRSTLELATLGLSVDERALIDQQVRMLSKRTRRPWLYVGEDSSDPDLLLVHAQRLGSQSFPRPTGVLCAATASIRPSIGGIALFVEWPVRLMGLLELLEQASHLIEMETRVAHSPVEHFLLRHANRGLLRCGELWLRVEADSGRIYASPARMDAVLSVLINEPQALRPAHPASPDDAPQLKYLCTCDSLRWSYALRSPDWAQQIAGHRRYRLGNWPRFGEWESPPEALRLAAYFSSTAATPSDAARDTGLSEPQVRAFLHACDICSLELAVTDGQPMTATPPKPRSPSAASGGFLARLRARLGLDFHRRHKLTTR